MTFTEIMVIVGGLLLGYWIVGSLFNRKPDSSSGSTARENAMGGAQQDNSCHEEPNNEKPSEEDYILTSWFRILEVSEDASQEQIIAAYRQKIRQYHPDKVAQLGAEIRELAEFKSKQINTAYDYAMKLQR